MPVTIQLTISDENAPTVLNAFNGLAGKEILLTILDTALQDEQWRFMFEPKRAEENNQQYALRVIKDAVVALVRLHDYAEDKARYKAAIDAVAPIKQDIPDNIIV